MEDDHAYRASTSCIKAALVQEVWSGYNIPLVYMKHLCLTHSWRPG